MYIFYIKHQHSIIKFSLCTELDVGSCQSLDGQSISHLSKIQTLERLNLYRLPVDKDSLIKVLRYGILISTYFYLIYRVY